MLAATSLLLVVPFASPGQAEPVHTEAASFGQDSLCFFSAFKVATTNCIVLSGGVQVSDVDALPGVMFCAAVAPGAVTVTVSCVTGTGVATSATFVGGLATASREDGDQPVAGSADICVTATATWPDPIAGTFVLRRCFPGVYADVE